MSTPTGTPTRATCAGVVATIVGTSGDDTLIGTNGRDVIAGLGGRDRVDGRGGDDLICGGANPAGYDLDHAPLFEYLDGGAGNDTIYGGPGFDAIDGGPGHDIVHGGRGDDMLTGFWSGGPFRTQGADVLFGGRGSDVISADRYDLAYGGPGDDYLSGTPGPNRLFGGTGDDTLAGGSGRDRLVGGPGDDILKGDSGADLLDGGAGSDTASYLMASGGRPTGVTVNLGLGTAEGRGAGHDRLRHVENAWGGPGADTLIGDDGPNTFYSGGSPAGGQPDRIHGRAGSDTLTFDESHIEFMCCDDLYVDLAAGFAEWTSVATVRFDSIENAVGSGGADVILGDGKNNTLVVGEGFGASALVDGRGGSDRLVGTNLADDRLYGGSGNDRLRGRGGNDSLRGGPGNDSLFGGSGYDVLDGGPGRNHNDGGPDNDGCLRPKRGATAVSCEY